jgi:hypothetical protein
LLVTVLLTFTQRKATSHAGIRILGFAEAATPTVGGYNSIGSVTLNSPAPAGGTLIILSSSNTNVATVPASVTVSAGQTVSPNFTITTYAQQTSVTVYISGQSGFDSVRSATLNVTP